MELCQKQESLKVDENGQFSWTNKLFNFISGIWKDNTQYKTALSAYRTEIEAVDTKLRVETEKSKKLFERKLAELETIKNLTPPQQEALAFLKKAKSGMNSFTNLDIFKDDICQVLDGIIEVPYIVRLMAFVRGGLKGLMCAAKKIELDVVGITAIIAKMAIGLVASSVSLPVAILIKTIVFLWTNYQTFKEIANYFAENDNSDSKNIKLIKNVGTLVGSFIVGVCMRMVQVKLLRKKLFKKYK